MNKCQISRNLPASGFIHFTPSEMRCQVSCDCPLSPRNRFSNFMTDPRGERVRVRGNSHSFFSFV